MSKPVVQDEAANKLKFHQAFLGFQKALRPVKKDGTNGHYRSTYATLNSALDAIVPVAHEFGFLFTQPISVATTQAGMKNIVVSRIIHVETGYSEESQIVLPECANTMKGMQELGGAITYARRYGAIALCGLQDMDDDGETAVGRPAKKTKVSNKDIF